VNNELWNNGQSPHAIPNSILPNSHTAPASLLQSSIFTRNGILSINQNIFNMKTRILPLALVLLAACEGKPAERGLIDGYMPVYSSRTAALTITSSAPQPFANGGKIATVGNTLYQVEQDKGIHIINISNPSLPVKIGFINVALCRELTLKGSYLYTNNINDLVVLNVSNPANVTESSRISNARSQGGRLF
jgi:hypothetical protein